MEVAGRFLLPRDQKKAIGSLRLFLARMLGPVYNYVLLPWFRCWREWFAFYNGPFSSTSFPASGANNPRLSRTWDFFTWGILLFVSYLITPRINRQ